MDIGINVMSSIGAMRGDFAGCIRKLKAGGCTWLEAMSDWGAKQETIDFYASLTGGSSGWDPENTIRRIRLANAEGMEIRGIFVFDELLETQTEKLGAYCQMYGISYIVLSFLNYGDIEDIYHKIAMIQRVCAQLEPYGVQILMHNHEHDTYCMKDKDGVQKQILSIFLEQCTSKELMLEIDTGWLVYAGFNAAEYIEKHLDRIQVLHLKDLCHGFETMPRDQVFVPCGQGVVDFPAIIRVAQKNKNIQYVLDQDASDGDIIEDHIQSINYLNHLMI